MEIHFGHCVDKYGPGTFVPGSARCSSALCLFYILFSICFYFSLPNSVKSCCKESQGISSSENYRGQYVFRFPFFFREACHSISSYYIVVDVKTLALFYAIFIWILCEEQSRLTQYCYFEGCDIVSLPFLDNSYMVIVIVTCKYHSLIHLFEYGSCYWHLHLLFWHCIH